MQIYRSGLVLPSRMRLGLGRVGFAFLGLSRIAREAVPKIFKMLILGCRRNLGV